MKLKDSSRHKLAAGIAAVRWHPAAMAGGNHTLTQGMTCAAHVCLAVSPHIAPNDEVVNQKDNVTTVPVMIIWTMTSMHRSM